MLRGEPRRAERQLLRPFRIGVALDKTSVFRPLMGMTAARDGGVIIWPRPVGQHGWSFARVDIPAGRYIGQPVQPDLSSRLSSVNPPKLHYHRSGWVSANLTGQSGRRGFKGLPLDRMHGQQFFTFTSCWPQGMPVEPMKVNDVMGIAHGAWPAQVHVEGFLYAPQRLRSSLLAQLPTDRAVGLVRDDRAEIVADLRGHGADVIVVIRVSLDDDPPEFATSTEARLAGFDSAARDFDGLSTAVSVWSDNTAFWSYGLTPPESRPFVRWTGVLAEPLVKRQRLPSGPESP